jgi:hypothetical protein
MIIVNDFYDITCFTFANFVQASFDEALPCVIKRVLKDVKWGGLIGSLECSRYRSKDNVPKQQAEEGGDNSAFTMITFVANTFVVL